MPARRKRPSRADAARTDGGRRALKRARAKVAAAEKADAKPKRSKLTADLPAELVNEVRAATVSLPPRVIGGSLSGLVEVALRRELERLRKEHNDGKPFNAAGEVRKGRPPRL